MFSLLAPTVLQLLRSGPLSAGTLAHIDLRGCRVGQRLLLPFQLSAFAPAVHRCSGFLTRIGGCARILAGASPVRCHSGSLDSLDHLGLRHVHRSSRTVCLVSRLNRLLRSIELRRAVAVTTGDPGVPGR